MADKQSLGTALALLFRPRLRSTSTAIDDQADFVVLDKEVASVDCITQPTVALEHNVRRSEATKKTTQAEPKTTNKYSTHR